MISKMDVIINTNEINKLKEQVDAYVTIIESRHIPKPKSVSYANYLGEMESFKEERKELFEGGIRTIITAIYKDDKSRKNTRVRKKRTIILLNHFMNKHYLRIFPKVNIAYDSLVLMNNGIISIALVPDYDIDDTLDIAHDIITFLTEIIIAEYKALNSDERKKYQQKSGVFYRFLHNFPSELASIQHWDLIKKIVMMGIGIRTTKVESKTLGKVIRQKPHVKRDKDKYYDILNYLIENTAYIYPHKVPVGADYSEASVLGRDKETLNKIITCIYNNLIINKKGNVREIKDEALNAIFNDMIFLKSKSDYDVSQGLQVILESGLFNPNDTSIEGLASLVNKDPEKYSHLNKIMIGLI